MSLIGSLMGRRKVLDCAVVTSTAALFRRTAKCRAVKGLRTMEERWKRECGLEEANKKLEREVTRARRIQEIQNMIGMMQQYPHRFYGYKSAEFLQRDQGPKILFPRGYWEGPGPTRMGKISMPSMDASAA